MKKLSYILVIALIWILILINLPAMFPYQNTTAALQPQVNHLFTILAFCLILFKIFAFAFLKDGLIKTPFQQSNTLYYLSHYFINFIFLSLSLFIFLKLTSPAETANQFNSIEFPQLLYLQNYSFVIFIIVSQVLYFNSNIKGIVIYSITLIFFAFPFYSELYTGLGINLFIAPLLKDIKSHLYIHDLRGGIYLHFLSAFINLTLFILAKKKKIHLITENLTSKLNRNIFFLGIIFLFAYLLFMRSESFAIVKTSSYHYLILIIFSGFTALIFQKLLFKSYHFSAFIDGVLAALVASLIDVIYSEFHALILAVISGIFVIISNWILIKLKIKNPGSLISIHGIGGLVGAIIICFFSDSSLQNQLKAIFFVLLFGFISAYIIFHLIFYLKGFKTKENRVDSSLDSIDWTGPIAQRLTSILAITMTL